MRLKLSEIREMLAAPQGVEDEATGYSIDSRSMRKGDLFFAIRGPHHDGHDFVEAALGAGAATAVVATEWVSRRGTGMPVERLIVVEDPAVALRAVAAAARRSWGKPVVAVTGSNGKTTTKEATSALLASRLRVAKSEGNLNNEYGLPLSLLRVDDDAEMAVVEMGMNHAGEIRQLAGIARPDVGVVTNVSAAHLEFFASVDDIALAKRELVESLGPQGTAVLNADDPRVSRFREIHDGGTVTFGVEHAADYQAVDVVQRESAGVEFRMRWTDPAGHEQSTDFRSPLAGRHNVANIAAAVAVCSVFDLEPPSLVNAVAGLRPAVMRGEFTVAAGVKLLNDCYNANPVAVQTMLAVLGQTPAKRRIAVLGEMRELGDDAARLHREVGKAVAGNHCDFLVAVEGQAREIVDEAIRSGMASDFARFFEDADRAGEFVAEFLRPGDAVLFKASRAVGMERAYRKALDRLRTEPAKAG